MEFPMVRHPFVKTAMIVSGFSVGLSLMAPAVLAQESITLQIDRATVIRAPAKTSTVVVGNPSIADVTVQKNGVIVLTAKSYGETNLLALDGDGNMVSETWLKVQAAGRNNLVVTRGDNRETYSCAPTCVPTMTLGDSEKYFASTGAQVGARNGAASASSPGK